MKERPIAFSPAMILAILANTKRQTRRFVTGTALEWIDDHGFTPEFVADPANGLSAYGFAGDRLWVREEHRVTRGHFHIKQVEYLADRATRECHVTDRELALFLKRKHPYAQTRARFMYRSFSRILLEITDVRIERLQSITEGDAIAEGVERENFTGFGDEPHLPRVPEPNVYRGTPASDWTESSVAAYRQLWEHLNGPGSWDANPFVWVITFKPFQP